jgi:hypothetical protein
VTHYEFGNQTQIKIMATACDTIVDAPDVESFVMCECEHNFPGGTGHWPVAAGYQPASSGRQVAVQDGLVARSTQTNTEIFSNL